MMNEPTPSHHPGQPTRHADFGTITEALDYAAQGPTGLNFYSGKGVLLEVFPIAVCASRRSISPAGCSARASSPASG